MAGEAARGSASGGLLAGGARSPCKKEVFLASSPPSLRGWAQSPVLNGNSKERKKKKIWKDSKKLKTNSKANRKKKKISPVPSLNRRTRRKYGAQIIKGVVRSSCSRKVSHLYVGGQAHVRNFARVLGVVVVSSSSPRISVSRGD